MSKYVHPGIAGVDLQRLLYYYTLLESCACTQYLPSATMTPDIHVKLLKKLKAVANGEIKQHVTYIFHYTHKQECYTLHFICYVIINTTNNQLPAISDGKCLKCTQVMH